MQSITNHHFDEICPYVIQNGVPPSKREITYKFNVLGFTCSNGIKVSETLRSGNVTIKPTSCGVSNNLEKGVFVQIKKGSSGVQLVRKVNESEVGLLKKNDVNVLPQLTITPTMTIISTNTNPSTISPLCMKLPTVQNTKKTRLLDNDYLYSSRLKSLFRPIPLIVKSEEDKDKILKAESDVKVDTRVYNNVKPDTRTIATNTDRYLLDDLIEAEVCRKKTQELKQTSTPVQQYASVEFDEILESLSMDRLHQQMEMHFNAGVAFKAQLFQDLQACTVFDTDGNLPLHIAIMDNNLKLVARYCHAMKIRRMNINSRNHNSQTPLQLAIISKADIDILQVLISQFGADLEVQDFKGNNILHLAVLYSDPEVVEILVRMLTAPIYNAPNFDGFTPLILSVVEGDLAKVEGLLKAGVNPNIGDQKSGRTALFHAIENNDVRAVSLLLEYDAETKVKNFVGTSPHDAIYDLDFINENLKLMILNHKNPKSRARKKRLRDTDGTSYTNVASKRPSLSPGPA